MGRVCCTVQDLSARSYIHPYQTTLSPLSHAYISYSTGVQHIQCIHNRSTDQKTSREIPAIRKPPTAKRPPATAQPRPATRVPPALRHHQDTSKTLDPTPSFTPGYPHRGERFVSLNNRAVVPYYCRTCRTSIHPSGERDGGERGTDSLLRLLTATVMIHSGHHRGRTHTTVRPHIHQPCSISSVHYARSDCNSHADYNFHFQYQTPVM